MEAVEDPPADGGVNPLRLPGPHLNGCVPLTYQVAGHKYGVGKGGILQHPDGTILKQVQYPPNGPREAQFYSMVCAEDCCDPCLLDLQKHLPKYYGTWSSPGNPNDLYLKLEDVARCFVRPCIMDVKLGQQTYDPFAPDEKREQHIRKYPLMKEMGFLILGMRVYNICNGTFETYNKYYGRALEKDTVKDGLAKFFHNGVGLRKDAVSASIPKVQQILQWFLSQNQLVFYGSSLLFVYEGLPSSLLSLPSVTPEKAKVGQEKEATENNNHIHVATLWDSTNHKEDGGENDDAAELKKSPESEKTSFPKEEDNSEPRRETQKNGNKTDRGGDGRTKSSSGEESRGGEQGDRGDTGVEVRMIDFAHTFPSQNGDPGYVHGLKHLLTVLEQILCDAAHT